MFITTRGLVLREVRYKESDKILTVLTQHEGKVTVRARGALRKGSRITAATQLLTYSDMTIFENRGRRTLNEASTVEEFLGLRADLGAFALGSYFAELLETVSAEEYPDPPVLQLGLNSLYALSRALCPPEQIKAVFELRLMCLSGYEPDLSLRAVRRSGPGRAVVSPRAARCTVRGAGARAPRPSRRCCRRRLPPCGTS
ncbi:MAG: DNA repair protein RecO [Oscillospiraceae bacterium]